MRSSRASGSAARLSNCMRGWLRPAAAEGSEIAAGDEAAIFAQRDVSAVLRCLFRELFREHARRSVEYDAGKPLRSDAAEVESNPSALRHADAGEAIELELVAQAQSASWTSVPSPARPDESPKPRRSKRMRWKEPRELRDLRLPHVEIERPAVNEQHSRPAALVSVAQESARDGEVEVRAGRRRRHSSRSNSETTFAMRLEVSAGTVKSRCCRL